MRRAAGGGEVLGDEVGSVPAQRNDRGEDQREVERHLEAHGSVAEVNARSTPDQRLVDGKLV